MALVRLINAISFIVIGVIISEAFVQQTMKDETVRSLERHLNANSQEVAELYRHRFQPKD